MQGLKTTLVMGFVMLFTSAAFANLDISCVDGDCLTYGWLTLDTRTNSESSIICRDNDCTTNGWYTEYKESLTTEVFCKPEGCFNEGWTVRDVRSDRVVADVSCQTSFANSDCLQYGWVTSEPGRGSYITRCVNGDCRYVGWDVKVPGYQSQPVRCKRGGCFSSGWIVYR